MGNGKRPTAKEIRSLGHRVTDCTTPVEHSSNNALAKTGSNGQINTPVRIHCDHYRCGRFDGNTGAVSNKAAIDGLVRSGLLPDDSDEYVEKVTEDIHKCKTRKEQRTVITIESVGKASNHNRE